MVDDLNNEKTSIKRRNISSDERNLIWRAHNQKCALTGQPISYAELQIDHIIPLDDGGATLARLQYDGLIDETFDINGLENLIPTRSTANRQKSGALLDKSAIVYFLSIAKAKKPVIEDGLRAERSAATYTATYLQAATDAGRNGYGLDEWFSHFSNMEKGESTIRFPLELSGSAIASANSVVATSLLDTPFSLAGAGIAEVTAEDSVGNRGAFKTPREFQAGMAAGYSPMTSFEINIWGSAERTTASLLAIESNTYATNSSLRFPRVTLENLERWSSRWITDLAYPDLEIDIDELAREYSSIQALLDAQIVSTIDPQPNENGETVDAKWAVNFEWDQGFAVAMYELLRGDLDKDDDEEILVSRVGWAQHGTLRIPEIMLGKVAADTKLIMPHPYVLT